MRARPSPFPLPPEHLRDGVSEGELYAIGEELVARAKREAGLNPSSRVLEIGCGVGRIAWPLGRELGPDGSYDGIDADREKIEWCANGLSLDPQRMRFHHLEPGVLPFPDGAFTLIIASENHRDEITRLLAAGGCYLQIS
jgi:ubiquinone/menaquinone biosynthesis C-methylase UbiE